MSQEKLMTLGIFAHANAGKTTITENLLYDANVISKIGRVDDGNTVTDSLKIEKQRGITVRASLVSFETNGKKVQLIDTPGHVDFSAEVERAISVLDGAVLVISGVEGIEAQTYTIWKALKQKNVPTIFFVNKMDRMGANYEKALKDISTKLEVPIIPLQKLSATGGENIKYSEVSFEDLIEYISNVHDSRVDDLLERYLNNDVKINEIYDLIETLSREGKVYPVIGGSALKSIGTSFLIDCIGKYLPENKKEIEEPFSAYVYTVRVDENNQKKLYMKVLSGKLTTRDRIILKDETEGKVTNLYKINGADLEACQSIESGEIAIVTGIDALCGELIGNQDKAQDYVKFVKPLINMEIRAKQEKDSLNLVSALKVLNDEDPYLNVRYDKNTGKIYMSLMGEVQAQVVEQMLRDRFNIESNLLNPVIIHKETPTKIGRGDASYTRVSSVSIEVKPLPEGSGLKYESKLSTDFLHKKYQRQVERLVKYYAQQGVFGWEVTDAEINLVDGRFDSMGSEPKHFNIAIPLALMRALKNANMKILEPISHYSVIIPKNTSSTVLQKLTASGGISNVASENEENITIDGEAPMEMIMNFPIELSKITSGRGIFSSVIETYRTARKQDIENVYIGADPRNEVTFVINDMKASLDALDPIMSKKKKVSRSKFKRNQREKQIRDEKKEEKRKSFGEER